MSKFNYSDDFILSQGQSIFDSSKTMRDLLDQRMTKDMDLYDGKFSETERKYSETLGIPRLFIKKTYTNVQRILIEIIDTIMGDPEEIVDISSWKPQPFEKLLASKTILNYRLNGNPIDFYKELYEASLDGVRTGMCALKVYPRLKTEKIKVPVYIQDEVGNSIQIEEREEEHVTDYEPGFECIPPEDVFVSKRATWKNYYKYPIVHKYKITKDECAQRGYKNYEALIDVQDEFTSTNIVKTQRTEDYQSPFNDDTKIKEAQEIWCYEVWDHLLETEEKELSSVSYILLGDDQGPLVVGRGIEDNELPYKFSQFETNRPPLILGFGYPEPHRLKGKSFPEITEDLQKQINADVNQEREAVARSLRPTTYINKDSEVDLMALLNRRIGGYVQGIGPADLAIREIQTQNPISITAPSRSRTEQDYYENGLPPNLLGTPTGEDTATGSTQQLQNANKKLEMVIKNLAYSAFIPAFKYLMRLEQVYDTDEFVRNVTGTVLDWGQADDNFPAKEVIQGDFDIKINLAINKQAQINKFLLIIDRMNQANQSLFQLVQSGVVNPQQIQFKNPMKIYEHLLPIMGIKNTAQYDIQAMPPPPPQQGQQPRGIASQPRNVADPSSQISQMSPSASGLLDVIG